MATQSLADPLVYCYYSHPLSIQAHPSPGECAIVFVFCVSTLANHPGQLFREYIGPAVFVGSPHL